jgi:hypothetical protein
MYKFILIFLLAIVLGCSQSSYYMSDPFQPKNHRNPKALKSAKLGEEMNSIRCEGPSGEREYLSRLICPDGSQPYFYRIGSFGYGPYGTMLDGYNVICGSDSITVFMDMYHRNFIEKKSIEGFQIK